MKTLAELRAELKALNYTRTSAHIYGPGYEEEWWTHPSGDKINLDTYPENPEANQRRVGRAKFGIELHEYDQAARKVAERRAAKKGLIAQREYYFQKTNHGHDWVYSLSRTTFGTRVGYLEGAKLAPKRYAKLETQIREIYGA
jgi:hypothetical protein